MKSTIKTAFVRVAVALLTTVFITGFVQADDQTHGSKEDDKTAELKVTKAGTGDATLTSSPAGIDCGATCRADFKANTTVTLTATAASGSVFKSWGGACKGTAPTCTVTLKKAQNVTAITALLPIALNVSKTGSGTGTVTSVPAGIDCGSVCSADYSPQLAANADDIAKRRNNKQQQDDKDKDDDDNDNDNDGHEHVQKPALVVTLTATPATGSIFNGWSGACTGVETTCTVTMNQSQNVSADFAPAFKTLALATAGSGTGTVTSLPAGIDCGATCSATFATDTVMTLTATPAAGSTFSGWFGACTGTIPTCTVALSQSRSVNASFSAPAVTTYHYDPNGNLTQITDPLGRIRQTQYDALNQPIRQLQPDPAVIGSTLGQIDTAYDSLGRITAIIDPRNLVTTYAMDSLGNLKQQTSPDTGTTASGHDAAGNLTTRTDARGQTAQYSYDSLDRIGKIVYDDQTVTYTWDNCANGIGRLCSLSNNTGSVSYNYDSHGRISQKSQSAGATPLTASHSYNAAGQRINTLSPSGQSLDYQWTGNRITAVSINGQPLLTRITYDPDGQVNGWFWGNNQPDQRFYDLVGRPAIISLGFDAKTQQPDNRSYGYDAAGRLINAMADIDPNLNQRHEYDQLDRLTGSERGEPLQSRTDYRYDLSGNRTDTIQDSTTLNSYSIDANSNRLQSQGGAQTVNYSYDPAGNLTGDGRFTHSYNAAGRRIASTDTTTRQTVTYGYDALGQRVSKTVAGTITQYVYDEQGHLTGEYDASGQLVQEIVWLEDLPVAVLKPATGSTSTIEVYYIHADHLGTPRKITRPSDNRVVWSGESEAFGNSLPEQNPSGLGDFVFNLRFPGQYYDQETGLFYNYLRNYNPATGRYIESDLIGLRGGINTYAYVENNPVNYIDPLGLDTISLSTNIQVPSFIAESISGIKGLGGIHSGVVIEFPGLNGGNWDFGGFFGADFAQSVGLGKSTLSLGWDKGSLCDLANASGEASALLGIFEGGLSFDPETNDLQGLHVGAGLAPGKIFKFLSDIAKGNAVADAYLNNMISVGGSKNVRVSSLRNACGCQ